MTPCFVYTYDEKRIGRPMAPDRQKSPGISTYKNSGQDTNRHVLRLIYVRGAKCAKQHVKWATRRKVEGTDRSGD